MNDMNRDLKIVKSFLVRGQEYVAVLCDDEQIYSLEVPERLLRRESQLALGGLTAMEARQRISCLTELVDRGLDWVTAVMIAEGDIKVALSGGGELVPLGTVSPSWVNILGCAESPLFGLTRAQAEEMVGAAAAAGPEGVTLVRPPCAACGRFHR